MPNFINTILLCMVIYGLYIIINVYNENNEIDNNIIEYKLNAKINKSKNKIDTNNIFNIKEYDEINDNIIIHNKYKNELIESKLEKEKKNNLLLKDLEQKINKLNKQFNVNIEIEINKDLDSNILKLQNEIKLFNNLLKIDINNLLNDIKNNKLLKDDKNKLLKELHNEINILKTKIKETNNSIEDNIIKTKNDYYHKLINKKVQLLNKKYKIYHKLFNN